MLVLEIAGGILLAQFISALFLAVVARSRRKKQREAATQFIGGLMQAAAKEAEGEKEVGQYL